MEDVLNFLKKHKKKVIAIALTALMAAALYAGGLRRKLFPDSSEQ